MATVDSLDIKISASAKTATTAIDNLVKKLDTLSASIGKIDGSRLSGLSNGVQKLGNAVRTLNGVKTGDYTRIANGLKKFAEIDTSRLSQTSSALSGLSRGLSAMGSVQNIQNITPAVNALKNLEKVNMSGIDTTKLASIATTLSTLGTSLAGVGKIEASTVRLVSAMARLSSSGQYISNVTVEFPKIGKAVIDFIGDIQKAGTVDTNIAKLVDGIARLASAGKRAKDTVDNMEDLGEAVVKLLGKLQHAPAINANIANTIQGLGNLAVSGGRASLASSNLGAGVSRLGNALKNLTGRMSGANIGVKSLINGFGALYIKFQLAKRAVMGFGKIVKSSMDYIEDLNYFNAAFGQVAEKADLKSFRKMGYESAEEYYNSFSQRAEQLTQKMSGFKINEKGMAISTGAKSMGIDPSLVMNYQAMFAQMSSSMGVASEMSAKLSNTFTKLGADLASVRNMEFEKVWQDMASGMVGMSRAVDKYGSNIRNMSLQQELANLGIDKSISKLGQEEKALVRAIIMLDSTRYAWGDMAKTIQQPANQLRLLQSSWSNLSRTIGNIFLPVVAKVLPYINAMTIVLQRFAEQVVKLLGFEDFDWGGLGATGGADFDFSDLADDTDSAADNMDKVAKKAKKASDNLQGFDIINKLQDNDSDSDSDKDKTKGLSAADLGKLTGALDKLMKDYDKVWNKAFKDMENKANTLATKMQKALVDAWKKGDFSELGKKVAAWINKGLAKIPWDKIKATVKKIARSIATFLNGFIEELDWALVGKTLAEGLNTIIAGAYEFWTTFDWLEFGRALGTAVDSFIKNFDAEGFGKLLGAKLRGIIQTAYGFVETFVKNNTFTTLGEKIGDAINGFFEDMGKVDERTGLTGWQELGKTISDSVKGILVTINTALNTVDWSEVGKSITQFLVSIDWWGILQELVKTLGTVLKSVVSTAISAIAEDPAGMIKALTGVFAVVFTAKNLLSGLSGLKGSIGSILSSVIGDGIGATNKTGLSGAVAKMAKTIGTTFKASLQANMAAAMAGTGISGTIFRGLSTAFSAVSGKVKALGATLKTAFTSEAFLANFAPVAIAVAAAVVSGKLIANRLNEAIDAINFTGDYEIKVPDKMKENAKMVQDSLEKTKQNAEETKKAIDEINKSVETTDGKNVKDLADKYFELSQKTNPTASDIAVMKKYSQELSQEIPGLSKNIDKQTGAFKGSKEQLSGMVSSLERAAKAQAAYNSSVELYEKQQENKKAIEEKEKMLKQYEKEFEIAKSTLGTVKKRSGVESEEYRKQLKLVGTYADKVNAARAEIKTLKGSQKDIASQIKKNNKIMNNANISTENYAKANKNLKDKMKELGVSTKSQKEVIEKLNKALDDGEIDWKDYKKLVDGNYKSIDELNGAIEKLSPKSVEVKATTSGKDDVSNLGNEIINIKDKDVTIRANAETTEAKYKINDLTTGKNVTITASLGNTKELTEKIKNALKSTPFKMTAAQIFPSKEQIAEYFKGVTQSKAWKNVTNFTPTPGKKVIVNDKNKTVKIPKDADFGGIVSAPYVSMGYKVSYYKIGGFPDKGQLFIAGEAGPELVGNMNGRTTVAPQNDIAEGFAQAITNTLAPVMYSAFKQAATETAQTNGGDVYLDGKKITDNVIGHVNEISKSRGRSPFWGVT